MTRAALLLALGAAPLAAQGASPAALGFDSLRLEQVAAAVQRAADSGAFPGAVLAVGRHGRLVLLRAVGVYGNDDRRPVTTSTVYDLASLTKVIALTTACMILVDEGRLDLDAPVRRYLPAFRGPGKDSVTIRHLLTHSSGLPAWFPIYRETNTRAEALERVDTTSLVSAPGVRFVYSDLGAIVMGQVVERITGESLDRFVDRRVFAPLGMRSTRFRPPAAWADSVAPTEADPWRGRVLRGEVHDENAARLEGVSAHAGLFANAPDLVRFATWLLERRRAAAPTGAGSDGTADIARPTVVQEFTRRQEIPPGSSRALGWDTPSEGSSAGTKLSPTAFGHTGFTGTSIWMDPERDLFVILLTNRVHPTRANTRIFAVRRQVADLVVDALVQPER
jgi:beta-N-acetylhexosaminidase